jgi:surfactin synthase thioesterase subunit
MMNDAARATVVFPGAGSFGSEFQPLLQALGPAGWLVKYPGRFGRDFGNGAESFDAVVQTCAEQVTGRAAAEVLLVGHSYGGYVAYATAMRLQDAGVAVSALVVVGADAPGRLRVSDQAIGTPAEAAAYLDAIDPGMLADAPSDDWREIVVETTMSDLRLLKQFEGSPVAGLRCPLFAVRGEEDPLASAAGVADWAHCTSGAFATATFPGGHSDFLRSAEWSSWVCGLAAGLD